MAAPVYGTLAPRLRSLAVMTRSGIRVRGDSALVALAEGMPEGGQIKEEGRKPLVVSVPGKRLRPVRRAAGAVPACRHRCGDVAAV
jgi:hypothetical protein